MTGSDPKGKKTFRQKMEEKSKNFDPSKFDVGEVEKNTLRMSLVIVIIGLFCLPVVEKGGSTFYVLIFVFLLNAALFVWIIVRMILRKRKLEAAEAAKAKARAEAKAAAEKDALEGKVMEVSKEDKMDSAIDRIMGKK